MDVFKFVNCLIGENKNRSLKVPLRSSRCTWGRPILTSRAMNQLPFQMTCHQSNHQSIRWTQGHVESTGKRARSASNPRPDGVQFRLHKNTLGVLKHLWKLMTVAWKKQVIPKGWWRAGGFLIPKEKNSSNEPLKCGRIDVLQCCGPKALSFLAE